MNKPFLLVTLPIVILLLLATTSWDGGEISAKETKNVKDSIDFNVGVTFEANLAMFKGRSVTLYLTSGQTLSGKVKVIDNNQLPLERLSGKEFYDALIRLDRIEALDARVR